MDNIQNNENENENENVIHIELTAIQRAKHKYYLKNKDKLMSQINIINKHKYNNDYEFREQILNKMKRYYQANKEKKKEYYLSRKKQKTETNSI